MAMQETPAPALPFEANQNDGSSATLTLIPGHAALTTQEAADLLNITRVNAERRAVLAELAAYDQELGL